jgi:hypothetical protein
MLLLPLLKPCKNPRCNKAVCLLITKPGEGTDLFLCHLPPVCQWQCLRQHGDFADILFETGATLRFKAATVITAQIVLWLSKKNY